MKSFRLAAKRGLTLIELVVVMGILIALAGLVIPRLDYLAGQSSHAAAATNTGELFSMLQSYTISNGKYPDNLDLLVDSSGAAYSKVFSSGGLPITAATLTGPPTDNYYRSMLEGGLNINAVRMNSSSANASNAGGSSTSSSSPNIISLMNDAGFGTSPISVLSNTGYYAPSIFTTLFPAGLQWARTTMPPVRAILRKRPIRRRVSMFAPARPVHQRHCRNSAGWHDVVSSRHWPQLEHGRQCHGLRTVRDRH